MILWPKALGCVLEAVIGDGEDRKAFRGRLLAVAMETVSTATRNETVGEFRFLVVDEDGQVRDVPATACQFGTNFDQPVANAATHERMPSGQTGGDAATPDAT